MARHTVAIVGGGFSGTLLALNLLRQASAPNVILVEREHPWGHGVAYSTHNPNHRLNVPAGRMSAFADNADDFLQWLHAAGHGGNPDDFVPRWLFGCYVRDRLDAAMRGAPDRLDRVTAAATAITMAPGKSLLRLDNGRSIHADRIVLATGNPPPHQLPGADEAFIAGPFYRGDPWAPDALAGLDPDRPVLLVGTGLTMVDTVISLLDAGHRGSIQAISRRGLVPHAHVPGPHKPFPASDATGTPFSNQLRHLRQDARDAATRGMPWQAVMDGVRPRIQDIWRAASQVERRRFLRHGRPWWDVHRHRIAPAVAARLDAARASGQLRTTAARIQALTAGPGEASIVYTPRGSSRSIRMGAARVINCTGPASDVTRSDDPLVQSLLAQNLARPDALKLGLDVTPTGELLRPNGTATPQLYALGPLTRGLWWEITSVPDIRRQCASLATHIAAA